jgi:16S rRNA (cytidine1402-2'-O)-methyltransferase
LAALSVSGLPTDRFLFEGFLPRKKGRSSRLKELAEFQGTVVIYESAVRIKGTLKDILTAFGPREAVLARELTKVHETVVRGSVGDILDAVERKQPKGECVILISKQVSV